MNQKMYKNFQTNILTNSAADGGSFMSIRSCAPLSTMNVLDASDKEDMQVKNDWRNTTIFDAAHYQE